MQVQGQRQCTHLYLLHVGSPIWLQKELDWCWQPRKRHDKALRVPMALGILIWPYDICHFGAKRDIQCLGVYAILVQRLHRHHVVRYESRLS